MKFIFLSFLMGGVLLFTECKKTSTSNINDSRRIPDQETALNATLNRSADSTLADSLINQYGLMYLTTTQTQGMQFSSYSSYATASAHIESVQQALSSVVSGSSGTTSGGLGESKPLPLPCDNGNYYANLSGSGGMFSSFNAIYSISASSVTNMDFVVTGTPIGWGWSQTGSYLAGSSGCTYGTITWGLTIGNLTIGYIQTYHFSWTLNPSACTISWSQGSGLCN